VVPETVVAAYCVRVIQDSAAVGVGAGLDLGEASVRLGDHPTRCCVFLEQSRLFRQRLVPVLTPVGGV
jgi:hypothetical protein